MFTFIADPPAVFDADREALLIKFVKDGEAGLDYSHGQTDNGQSGKKKRRWLGRRQQRKLLVFLPERRHGPQLGDDRRHFLEDKVHLFFGVVDR